jgi:uncharacterized membrane protein
MKRSRMKRISEMSDRLSHDRKVRKSISNAAKCATAIGEDVRKHGVRRVAGSDRTGRRLQTIANAASDVAKRSSKPRHRRWPWVVGTGAALAGAAAAVRTRGGITTVVGGSRKDKAIVTAVDLDVPVRQAYDQWTQFEQFPSFMGGIDSVTQIDDTHLRWSATVAGTPREWHAEITEQMPDQRIAWRSTDGGPDGVITFHRLGDNRCRVTAQIGYAPDGLREQAGHLLGVDALQVQQDLGRFKQLIESRGTATGAWRGTVEADS